LFTTNQTLCSLYTSVRPLSSKFKFVYKNQPSSKDRPILRNSILFHVVSINQVHRLDRLASFVSYRFYLHFISRINHSKCLKEDYLQLEADIVFIFKLTLVSTPVEVEKLVLKYKGKISDNAIRFAQVYLVIHKEDAKALLSLLKRCAGVFRLSLTSQPLDNPQG
jgi:hypothetical protein